MADRRHIGVVTASRADFGLLAPLIRALHEDPDFRVTLYATGMHFSPRHGRTVDEIRDKGFADILVEVPAAPEDDSPGAWAAAMSRGVAGFGDRFATERPALLVIMGDRFDVLSAAVASLPFGVPIAHVSGGELSEGVVDDQIRHAITKMSHLHFTSHARFAERVMQMGEEPWRVTVSGEPGLDAIAGAAVSDDAVTDLSKELGLEDDRHVTAFTFHPEGADRDQSRAHIDAILAAAHGIDTQIVFTYPNADPGSAPIIDAIEAFCRARPDCGAYPSLGRDRYLALLTRADCMVGNSSSGMVEAASFALPVVDIGARQDGRIAPPNVISAPIATDAVEAAWRRALSATFRAPLKGMRNPYGDGKACSRIVSRLKTVDLDDRLLRKKFHEPGQDAGIGSAERRRHG